MMPLLKMMTARIQMREVWHNTANIRNRSPPAGFVHVVLELGKALPNQNNMHWLWQKLCNTLLKN
jgi:hypothetical protein